jgi:hypothetical protein
MFPSNARAILHRLRNWQIFRRKHASSNRRDSGQWLQGDRPFLPLWHEHFQTTRFYSGIREHSCCSSEPSCFGENQRSAIILLLIFRWSRTFARFSGNGLLPTARPWIRTPTLSWKHSCTRQKQALETKMDIWQDPLRKRRWTPPRIPPTGTAH